MSYSPQPTTTALAAAPSDTQALLNAAAAMGKPHKNPDPDGMHYAVVPEGYTLKQLPEADLPPRAAATVKLRDTASFIRYVNDQKLEESRIYASLEPASFLAVLDDFGGAVQAPAWRGFRAEFKVPPSREWLLWNKANRQHFSQLAFAEFLQDNLPDVRQPAGAALLEMALNFETAQAGHFVAAQRLQDGSHNLQWRAENNYSGSVKLPEFITLGIPVFENEEPSELQARLRYRLKEGVLSIWFELVRPHKALEAAFRSAWARIAEETGVVVLLGSPE